MGWRELSYSISPPYLTRLDIEINAWVQKTKSIIAVPGPLVTSAEGVALSLTFVAAAEGISNG